MNNETFSITPPPELVKQWQASLDCPDNSCAQAKYIAARAARWGSDQELEACCEWLGDAPVVYNDNGDLHPGSYLRDARRPKPPSLKEGAIEILDELDGLFELPAGYYNTILRALEKLDDSL